MYRLPLVVATDSICWPVTAWVAWVLRSEWTCQGV
jgi:hypothetical protein